MKQRGRARPWCFALAACLVATFAHAKAPPELVAARLLQAAGHYPESDSLCRVAITTLDVSPITDSLALAEALHRFSAARLTRFVYTDTLAREACERAIAIRSRALPAGSDDTAQSRLLSVRWLLGVARTDLAASRLRELIEARRPHSAPTDTVMSEAWRGLGFVHRDRGELVESIAAYDSAIAGRIRARGSDRIVALTLSEIGRCLLRLGQIEAGRDSMLRAVTILRRCEGPDSPAGATVFDYLATLERDAGNLTRCIDYSQEAVRLASTGPDPVEIARMKRNMSSWLIELGDYHGSQALLDEVLPVYRRSYGNQHWRVASVLASLGNVKVAMGDSSAMSNLREAEAIRLARTGAIDPELARIRHTQAMLLSSQGRSHDAAATCELGLAAAAGSASMRIVAGQLHSLRVRSLTVAGDTTTLEAARIAMLRNSVEQGLDSSSIGDEVHDADARALARLGRAGEAWDAALRAEQLARESSRRVARSLGDQHALLHSSRVADRLDHLFSLARDANPALLEQAWDRGVRGRGLVRAELARRHAPMAMRDDSALVGAHGRWDAAQQSLARATLAAGTDRGAPARAALERARAHAAERERLYAQVLAGLGLSLPIPEVSLSQVREHLAANEALVSVFETNAGSDSARVMACIARGHETTFASVDLGRSAVLRDELHSWRVQLARWPSQAREGALGAEQACRRAGLRVRALTWDLLAPHLAGMADIQLVADGPLLSLPWQALPSAHGRYLVEDGPNLHLLMAERDLLTPPAVETASLFALGAPDFGTPVAGTSRHSTTPCEGGMPMLGAIPATRSEIADVAAAWRAAGARESEATGPAATEARFRAEAPGSTVVHLATHGIVLGDECGDAANGLRGVGGLTDLSAVAKPAGKRPRATTASRDAAPAARSAVSPWAGRRTWLALAGAQLPANMREGADDGRLTAEEVVTLDLSATHWVVLSACHSGLADSWSREGALGMRRAFSLAGARAVIASEWSVEDAATREWMARLHGRLASGAGTAQAMSGASREVLLARRAAGRTTHPFYWAAFTASGD